MQWREKVSLIYSKFYPMFFIHCSVLLSTAEKALYKFDIKCIQFKFILKSTDIFFTFCLYTDFDMIVVLHNYCIK